MLAPPKAEKGMVCPFHKKDVSLVCHKCPLYMALRSEDGEDHWGCAFVHLPVLLVENAKQTRGAAAATEDARNAIVEIVSEGAGALLSMAHDARDIKLLSGR